MGDSNLLDRLVMVVIMVIILLKLIMINLIMTITRKVGVNMIIKTRL